MSFKYIFFISKKYKSIVFFSITLLLILYFTLYPFEFFFKKISLEQWFSIALSNPTDPIDIVANIALFVPLGASSYLLLREWTDQHPIWALSQSTFFAVVTSFAIELVQLNSSERIPTISDIIFNTSGGLIGAFFCCFCRDSLHTFFKKKAVRIAIISLCIFYFINIYIGLLESVDNTKTKSWNTNYPLTIGNDPTGHSPWSGKISNVTIFNSALKEKEIAKLFENKKIIPTDYPSLLAYYPLKHGVFSDLADQNPSLSWQGTSIRKESNQSVDIDGNTWLQSKHAVTSISHGIEMSSEFTLSLIIVPEYSEDFATILALSDDSIHSNLVLGVEKNQVLIRIRTPLSGNSGNKPELVLSNFYKDFEEQHLIITFSGLNLKAYLDTTKNIKDIALIPGLTLFQPLSFFYEHWKLQAMPFSAYKYIFLLFIFIPLHYLVLSIRELASLSYAQWLTLYIGSIFIFALIISSAYTTDSISFVNESMSIILFALVIMFLMFSLLWLSKPILKKFLLA